MGFFNRKKKLDDMDKHEFLEWFEGITKEMIEDKQNDPGFFFLTVRPDCLGKGIKCTPKQFEEMFSQLFQEAPELMNAIEKIITKYKNGEIKLRPAVRKEINPELREVIKKKLGSDEGIGKDNIKINFNEDNNSSISNLLNKMKS